MPLRCLNARRQDVINLLHHAETLRLSRDARRRLAWFAYALAHDGNISLTCRYFGISRATFLRWAKRFDPKRPETLEDQSRKPHTVRAPETTPKIVALIREYRTALPTMGKNIIAQKLFTEHTLTVSASTVGRVIERERLFFGDLPSHQHKRSGIDFAPDATQAKPAATASSASTPEALRQGSGQAGEAGAMPAADQLPLFGS